MGSRDVRDILVMLCSFIIVAGLVAIVLSKII
jgi:hypothetical protein